MKELVAQCLSVRTPATHSTSSPPERARPSAVTRWEGPGSMYCPPQQLRPTVARAGSPLGCSPQSGGLGGPRKVHFTARESAHKRRDTVPVEGRMAVSAETRSGGFLEEETPPSRGLKGEGRLVQVRVGASEAWGKEGSPDHQQASSGSWAACSKSVSSPPMWGTPRVGPPVPRPQHRAQRQELLTVWSKRLTEWDGAERVQGPRRPRGWRGSWPASRKSEVGKSGVGAPGPWELSSKVSTSLACPDLQSPPGEPVRKRGQPRNMWPRVRVTGSPTVTLPMR